MKDLVDRDLMCDSNSPKIQHGSWVCVLSIDKDTNLAVCFPFWISWVKDGKINRVTYSNWQFDLATPCKRNAVLSLVCQMVYVTQLQ